MKIILHPHEGASRADLIDLVSAAHCALANGFAEKKRGEMMIVSLGGDPRYNFGVFRREGCVTVYPQDKTSDPA